MHGLAHIHQGMLSKSAGATAHDPIAWHKAADTSAQCQHLTCALHANGFCADCVAMQSMTGNEFAAVKAGRMHAHQDLAGSGCQGRRVAHFQCAVAIGHHLHPVRLHGGSLFRCFLLSKRSAALIDCFLVPGKNRFAFFHKRLASFGVICAVKAAAYQLLAQRHVKLR